MKKVNLLDNNELHLSASNRNNPSTFEDVYAPPFFLFNAHLETIFPSLLRRVTLKPYARERIETPDGDFLDLDWLPHPAKKLVIISHGLEGDSHRAYVRGMAKVFYQENFDVMAWNFRGCSGEVNRKLRFYHSGATEDLQTVVTHALKKNNYDEVYLIGFSLGGNLTLKYLGENNFPKEVKKGIGFSVPLHLQSSCEKISTPANRIYAQRFLRSLKKKILDKASLMGGLDVSKLKGIKTLMDFDDAYTAPLHGFSSAIDYYSKCSSLFFLDQISVPTLIVNTRNDPFLSSRCFPIEELRRHAFVKLLVPEKGGHVGFTQINKNGLYWSEQRALDFIQS